MSNLGQRVIVGAVAIPIILLLCMAGGIYFFVFIALTSAVALHEFYTLAAAKGARPLVALGIAAGFAVNLSFFLRVSSDPPMLVIVLLVTVVVLSLRELFRPNSGSAVLNLSTTLFGVMYISLFFGSLIGIRQLFVPGVFPIERFFPGTTGPSEGAAVAEIHRWGGFTLISILAVIWICDSAAFHVGSPFGKHKLYPRVSPNKSWEGAVAGLVFAILSAIGAKYLMLPYLPVSGAIVLGLVVGIIGQLGDLAESLLKRDAGVKDSSGLIPGHGGAFDRFDSLLLVSPCMYLYLTHLLRVPGSG